MIAMIKGKQGVIGRRVRVEGRRGEWIVRTLETQAFGRQYGLTREGGDFWILAPRRELKFVRGDFRDREAEAALAGKRR